MQGQEMVSLPNSMHVQANAKKVAEGASGFPMNPRRTALIRTQSNMQKCHFQGLASNLCLRKCSRSRRLPLAGLALSNFTSILPDVSLAEGVS